MDQLTMMDKPSDMDIVQKFNLEISSLHGDKPTISKGKMAEITRIAIDGIKVYKFIVQAVEKFIHKCKPEFKLSALYIIDAIVRHSKRHEDIKDLYAMRFTRNLMYTFQNLFLTSLPSDKCKIVKVLNLWQKNAVFPPHVIQRCLDLARNPQAKIEQLNFQLEPTLEKNDNNQNALNVLGQFDLTAPIHSADEATKIVTQLADKLSHSNGTDNMLVKQLKVLAHSLDQLKNEEDEIKAKSNYIDEDDGSDTPTEAEPRYVRSKPKANQNNNAFTEANSIGNFLQSIMNNPLASAGGHLSSQLEDPFLKANAEALKMFTSTNNNLEQSNSFQIDAAKLGFPNALPKFTNDRPNDQYSSFMPQPEPQQFATNLQNSTQMEHFNNNNSQNNSSENDRRTLSLTERLRDASGYYQDRDYRARRSERKSRSRSRSPRARRSPHRPARVEHFPPTRRKYTTIGSVTLWLGQVPKTMDESDIRNFFKKIVEINQINCYPSRGCAYVCFNSRKDASLALSELNSSKRIRGEKVKFAWAPGKGIKDEQYKQYWEKESGCSFLPHSHHAHSSHNDLFSLEDGGEIDKNSLPDNLKAIYEEFEKNKAIEKERERNPPPPPPVEAPPPTTITPAWLNTDHLVDTIRGPLLPDPLSVPQDASFPFDMPPPPSAFLPLPPIGTWNSGGELFKSVVAVEANQQTVPILTPNLAPLLSNSEPKLKSPPPVISPKMFTSVIDKPKEYMKPPRLFLMEDAKFAEHQLSHFDIASSNGDSNNNENQNRNGRDGYDFRPEVPMPFGVMPPGGPPPHSGPDGFFPHPFPQPTGEDFFVEDNPPLLDHHHRGPPHHPRMPYGMPLMGHPPPHFDMPRFNRPPMQHFEPFMPPHLRPSSPPHMFPGPPLPHPMFPDNGRPPLMFGGPPPFGHNEPRPRLHPRGPPRQRFWAPNRDRFHYIQNEPRFNFRQRGPPPRFQRDQRWGGGERGDKGFNGPYRNPRGNNEDHPENDMLEQMADFVPEEENHHNGQSFVDGGSQGDEQPDSEELVN